MKTLTIYGASDDLIETSGLPGCDEFNVYGDDLCLAKLVIASDNGNLNIYCIYDGGWAFAITTPDGSSDEYPDWKIERHFGGETPYSETVVIECPDDAVLKFEKAR